MAYKEGDRIFFTPALVGNDETPAGAGVIIDVWHGVSGAPYDVKLDDYEPVVVAAAIELRPLNVEADA